jgi:hypothetical protein
MGGDFFSDRGPAEIAPSPLPAFCLGLCCFFMVEPAHQVVTSLGSAVLTCKHREPTYIQLPRIIRQCQVPRRFRAFVLGSLLFAFVLAFFRLAVDA